MKSLIFASFLAFSTLSFGSDICSINSTTDLLSTATCLAKIFLESHQETYYGSYAYLSNTEYILEKTKKVLSEVKAEITDESADAYFVSDKVESILEEYEFVALVIEEQDQPAYILYAMTMTATAEKPVFQKIAKFNADIINYENYPKADGGLSASDFGYLDEEIVLGFSK